MTIERTNVEDLPEILELQYLAYQSEGDNLNNYQIQPLTQTLEEMTQEFHNGAFYKAIDENGSIIGSVRGKVNNGTLYVAKLMVHPDLRGKGIGTSLLHHIEEEYPSLRKELFTSALSESNIRLYEKNGYTRFMTGTSQGGIDMVYLQKNIEIYN